MQPLYLYLALAALVLLCGRVLLLARQARVKLGIWGTFLLILAGTAALIPVSQAIAAGGDQSRIALGATLELVVLSLAGAVLTGWRQADRTEGALTWLGVGLLGYVVVVLSFSEYHLPRHPSWSGFRAMLLSVALYQAAFFLMHYLRHRRR